MKKRVILGCGLVAILLSGCFFQLPEKISVKTNASYNFSMGKMSNSFNDSFSVKGMMSSASSDNTRIKVYDYNPDGKSEKVQQYLIKLPIQEIPVDFSSYFEGSQLFDDIEGMSFEKELEIPSIKNVVESDFDMSGLGSAISLFASMSGTTNNETFSYASDSSFSSITYKSGKLIITNPLGDITGRVYLYYHDNLVSSGYFIKGKAELSLNDVTLYSKNMTIKFDDNLSGKLYTGVVSSDSVVARALGVNLKGETIPIVATCDPGLTSSGVTECIVKEGSLGIDIKFPNSWENAAVKYDLSLSGALSAEAPESAARKEINMNGKTITASKLNVTMNMKMNVTNGTFIFTDKPVMTSTLELSSFESITMQLKDVATTLKTKEKLSNEMREFIKSVTTKESGISGTYTNELPAGNDITLTSSSDFFGLDGNGILKAATSDGDVSILSSSTPKTINFKHPVTKVGSYDSMDYSINILFPGATKENPDIVCVKNVSSGESYKVSVKLSSKVCWTEMVMYSSGSSQNGSIETGLSLGSIFNDFDTLGGADFSSKAAFSTIPLYLYFERPDISAFNNATFRGGFINCYMGKKDNGRIVKDSKSAEQKYLSTGETLNFKEFPKLALSSNAVTTNIDGAGYSLKNDLAPILNSTGIESGNSLCLNYELQFSTGHADEFTISYDDYKVSSNGATSIAIYAAIILPLQFDLTDSVNVNFLGLAGQSMDTDLFGRTSAPTEIEKNEFLSAIQSASIVYKNEKLPFYSNNEIKFLVNFSGSENTKDYEILAIEEGAIQINPMDLMYTYPLIPKMYMVMPKSTFSLAREMVFDTSLSLNIQTNGLITIFGGK